jgi:hypothetical protein
MNPLSPGLPLPLLLLAAAGLTFAVQNDKIPGFRVIVQRARDLVAAAEVPAAPAIWLPAPRWAALLAAGVRCTYCTGIHAGWIVWLLATAAGGWRCGGGISEIPAAVLFAFAAGMFCYGLDESIAALERSGAAYSGENR